LHAGSTEPTVVKSRRKKSDYGYNTGSRESAGRELGDEKSALIESAPTAASHSRIEIARKCSLLLTLV
jgi:hypothetical protein